MSVRNSEELVYAAAVVTGEILIMPDGTCWRVAFRQGVRGREPGATRLIQCPPRRAEDETPSGFLQIRVVIDGKRRHTGAHRLVWRHFKGPLPPGRVIRHKNKKRTDNRPENLTMKGVK